MCHKCKCFCIGCLKKQTDCDCTGKENAFWGCASAVPCDYVFLNVFFMFFTHETLVSHLLANLGIGQRGAAQQTKNLAHIVQSLPTDDQNRSEVLPQALSLCLLVEDFSIPPSKKPVLKEVRNAVIIRKKNAWCSFKNAMEDQFRIFSGHRVFVVCLYHFCSGDVLYHALSHALEFL